MKELVMKGFKTAKEVSEPEVSKIIGNVPDWVTGRLIRNGPGKWDFQNFHMQHVFDGYNLITKFDIRGGSSGTVSFSSKYLQSEAFKKAEVAQKPVYSEYSTRSASSDAKKSVFQRMISTLIPEQTDNCPFICSTSMGKNPIAVGDTGYMFEVDRTSLECLSRHDPVKEFGVHCLTSHPMVCEDSGYTYNIGISLFSGAKWNILRFPPGNCKPAKESIKKAEVVVSFPCRNKTSIPWLHSFGVSKNYIIIIDQPSYFNVTKVISSIFSKGVCPKDLNEWRPEQKCRFYFVHKGTGKVVKTEILSKDAFFFYHILNCYEEKEHIVIDVFCMPNFQIVDNQTMVNLRNGHKVSDKNAPTLQRYVIPLAVSDLRNCPEDTNLVTIKSTAKAIKIDSKICLEPEIISNIQMECCCFNRKFVGQPLRYFWSSGAFAPSRHQHKIFKFDMQTRKAISWHAAEHQFVGEPLFLPNPNRNNDDNSRNSGNEDDCDDGIIINVVTNCIEVEGEKDFILFLNAKNFEELGRAYFKAEIPMAFHGVFVSD